MINRDQNDNFTGISCNGCNVFPDKQELLTKGGLRGMNWFIGTGNYHLCPACKDLPEHAVDVAKAEESRSDTARRREAIREQFHHAETRAA